MASNGALAFVNGELGQWFVTSLASPTFGSVLTLVSFSYDIFRPWLMEFFQLDEERAVHGKGPIGFVNPVLYVHPEVLNDIVNGTDLGCGSDGFQSCTWVSLLQTRSLTASASDLSLVGIR